KKSFQLNSLHYDFVPWCFSPPVIEDSANHRILTFRDGLTGLRELRMDAPLASRRWEQPKLGDSYLEGLFYDDEGFQLPATRAHPSPFELMSAEHATMTTLSDPARRYNWPVAPTYNSRIPLDPKTHAIILESQVNNLFWPFRL